MFADTEPDDWDRYVQINFYGVLNCVHVALPAMIDARWGRVVTLISDAARVGEPRTAAYPAPRRRPLASCRSVAREVGRYNITANCVSLGTMNSARDVPSPGAAGDGDQILKKYVVRRRGSPSDIAAMVMLPGERAVVVDHRADLSGQRRLHVLALSPSERHWSGVEGRAAGTIVGADGDGRRRTRRARCSTSTWPTRGSPRRSSSRSGLQAAAAARGRGRRRQDRGGQGARPLDRRRAGAAAVLRGHRRLAGRLRVGLLPPAAAPPGGRGRRRGGRRGRAVLGAVPREAPAAAGDRVRGRGARRGRAAGAARRRGRPRRRRVRGVPARDPLRLHDHRARARHVPRRGTAARGGHVEPHP